MMDILPYNLPDAVLLDRSVGGENDMITWVPERLVAVIGCGSDPVSELNSRAVQARGIPVFRRPTGGCSVILSPNMLVASFVAHGQNQLRSSDYFRIFNRMVIQALHSLAVRGLYDAGTSDIALEGRKVAGSALYRTRETVFYHSIINAAENPSTIAQFLAMPPRSPDYREGRSHNEFITSLDENGYRVDFAEFRYAITNLWQASPAVRSPV